MAALPLLLDAEQTHRQPAISMLARTPPPLSNPGCNIPHISGLQPRAPRLQHPACAFCSGTLSREYNAPGAPPLLYNTHQAYLRGAEVRLR